MSRLIRPGKLHSIERIAPRGSTRRGWPWFAAWVLPGAIAVMSLTALAFLALPALLIAVMLLLRLRASAVEALLGFFAGAGVVALGIGLGASGDRVCPHRAVVTATPSFECVADRWWPTWIAFGASLFALAVLAYAAVRILEK